MALNRLDKLIALNCNVSRKEARELVKSGKVKGNQPFTKTECGLRLCVMVLFLEW